MLSHYSCHFGSEAFNNKAILLQPVEVQLGWAAGFIDGDGCISPVTQIYPNRRHPGVRIRVSIVQNDHFTLTILKSILGEKGHLNMMARQPNMNRQPYVLAYDGRHAINVIRKILPYLVRKSAEAQACICLYHEGHLDRHPGIRGLAPEIVKVREKWVSKIKRLK